MGGGTGTGAAPIIAQAARELGVLTVGVVTKPFQFEGAKRMRKAEEGVENLQKVVDTLIIIPNQNLFRLANEKTTFTDAFSMADDVLYQGVKGVTDLMVRPGLINLDFADVRAVMDEMGKAMMGTGEAEGESRAIQAAEKAIANPLLDEISLRGARGVLINITGGYDLTLFELDEAANRIREEVDPDANIIVGSTLDTEMNGMMRVSVVATGIDASVEAVETPVPRRSLATPLTNKVSVEVEHEAAEAAAIAARAPAPAAAQPAAPVMHAPAPTTPAATEVLVEEPTLFQDLDPQPTAPSRPHVSDDLPPPAYAPQSHTPARPGGMPAAAMAPRAPSPGTPSPETLRRLEAAVRKVPEGYDAARSGAGSHAASGDHAPSADKSRFGINSLINRMTGQANESQRGAAGRSQPPMQSLPQDLPEDDADLDKIEIPAFLRRQAN
ncbi:MAG: cell division protein FtsZ, partial [Rhodobacteraceae bacterium]|nr:cell division protein FtsZ [Paracoccaceae bacterium]